MHASVLTPGCGIPPRNAICCKTPKNPVILRDEIWHKHNWQDQQATLVLFQPLLDVISSKTGKKEVDVEEF